MAVELNIPTIIQIGQLSQALANVENDKNIYFKGGVLDIMLPKKIYWVWKPLALRYAANPNDTTLRQVAEWLLQLCGTFALRAQNILNNLTGVRPILTGPLNQSVNVGQTATFSVSVSGVGPFVYQWFANGIAIPGANASSYPVTNAQLSQNGTVYSVQVSNAAGPTTSNTATLTVTAQLLVYYYQGDTDFSTQLLAGSDTIPYNGSVTTPPGQPIQVSFPFPGATKYIVLKYPITLPVRTSYLNPPPTGPDQGPIPGLALNETTFGGWNYVFSREGNPFGLNSSGGGDVSFS